MRRRQSKLPPNQVVGGDSFFKPKVQPKLTTGTPGDKYEVEADHMADQVVNKTGGGDAVQKMESEEEIQQKPLAASVTPLVQKMENSEEEAPVQKMEEEEPVQAMEEEEPVQAMEEEEPVQAMEEEEPVQAMEEEEPVQAMEEEEPVQAMEEEDPVQAMEEEEPVQAMEEEEPVQAMEEEEPVQAMEEEEPVQAMEEEEPVQAKKGNTPSTNSNIEKKLRNGSGGSKMDSNTRSEMESGFGADFSNVNIHNDSEAAQMSQNIGAQAFTHGNDVYFNEGKYNPDSKEGKHLLAHELTHTIQQKGMIPTQLQLTIGDNNDLSAARFSRNNVLEACLDGEQTLQNGSSGAAVSLMQQGLVDAGFPLPRFGVDGIFGNETRTALRNFQTQSSLGTTGVLNIETMSALDALFTGGAPALAPVVPVNPAPTTPPVITTETTKSAPDGTADSRKTVGVGEYVRLTANTAGTWTASDGRIIGLNNGSNIVWEAPADIANPTITLTTPGGTRVIPFSVIRPNSIQMSVSGHNPIAVGTAGADMLLDITFNPLNVNFGRTQLLEVPGPGTNVSGYFNRFTAAQLFHVPNANFVRIADDNTAAPARDNAAIPVAPPPFSFGTWEWVIPNQYKVDGEPDANGRVFTHTTQSFLMLSNGTVIITKAGAFVLRTINNTIF
ncbi:MAG: peptidoglycan hydrolase-like protein with peptidoglycan-binding domain [Aureispira sp.]|jgi:peptidoglycan hydrolase-like protein with peptidoglycan-binding domain